MDLPCFHSSLFFENVNLKCHDAFHYPYIQTTPKEQHTLACLNKRKQEV